MRWCQVENRPPANSINLATLEDIEKALDAHGALKKKGRRSRAGAGPIA